MFTLTGVLQSFGFKRKNRNPKAAVPCSLMIGIASKLTLTHDVIKLKRHLELKHARHEDDTVLHAAIRVRLSCRLVAELLKVHDTTASKYKINLYV